MSPIVIHIKNWSTRIIHSQFSLLSTSQLPTIANVARYYQYVRYQLKDTTTKIEPFSQVIFSKVAKRIKQLAFIMSSYSTRYVNVTRIVEKTIQKFMETFDKAYIPYESFMWKINLHYLKHFPKIVRHSGLLQVQSAYSTENTMGHLAKRVVTEPYY